MGKAPRRPRPRWGTTVPLPAARPGEDQHPPRIVAATKNGPLVVQDPALLPLDELLPSRTFRSHVGHRHAPQQPHVGVVGAHIKVESLTEAVAAHRLSRRAEVVRLYPQPCWIERVIEGRPSWACPDFLVVSDTGARTVVEVKAASDGLGRRTLTGLAAVRASCHHLGLGFELMTGLDSHDQAIFDLLYSYSGERAPLGPGWRQIQADILREAREPRVLSDLWALGPAWLSKPLIWWMLWHDQLCFDWSLWADDETKVLRHDAHTSHVVTPSLAGWRCGPMPDPTLDELWEQIP